MGYFKQQQIASMVEAGDRVPAPKPVTHHVAYPTRRLARQIERATTRRLFKRRCIWALSILGGLALVGLGIGVGVAL